MERRNAFKYIAISAAGLATVPFWVDSWTTKKLPAVNSRETDDHKLILAELVGAIIPATDIPGAKELEVDKFVYTIVADCFEKEKQVSFFAGLEMAASFSYEKYGKLFVETSNAEKLEVVQQIDVVTIPGSGESFDFVESVKELTIMGYMTSEYIMTNILKYEMIPSRFHGSFPVEKI